MNRAFKVSILLYILADLIYVFFLQYHNPVDGDLVAVALPSKLYAQVLDNPLGLDAILHHQKYPGSNGFLGYSLIHRYFGTMPFFFQHFTTPINSIYMACAFFVAIMKGLYIYILAYYVSGNYKLFNKNFLIAAAIITPLIQTGGYRWNMGIVDPMLVCVFGYTRSNLLVLTFFLPFFLSAFHDKQVKFGPVLYTAMILLAIYNGYNGPLSGPLMCVIFCFVFLALMFQHMKQSAGLPFVRRLFNAFLQIPRQYMVLCFVTLASSIYCYYLGKFNVESAMQQIPMAERYRRLPIGLREHFAVKGLGMLSVMILINTAILIFRENDDKARKILKLLGWILVFCIIFTLTLPLGGYRFYRPNIIRRDVFSPVVITLIAFYGISSFYILRSIALHYRKIYMVIIAAPLFHYAIVNTYYISDNSCEKNAMKQFAASKDKIVVLDAQCPVLAWEKITDYKKSEDVAAMLRFWGVIKEEKYFYQK